MMDERAAEKLAYERLRAQHLTRMVWLKMMQGDVRAWLTFFRLIEVGSATQMIRENSVTYDRRTASR
jgi:hypothetical protein